MFHSMFLSAVMIDFYIIKTTACTVNIMFIHHTLLIKHTLETLRILRKSLAQSARPNNLIT